MTTPLIHTRHSAIIRMAIPIILANASVPLLGLVDTAIIGHTGSAAALGAIALGSLIFSFLYWGFGFLRMGTSGFTAQAAGAGDHTEVRSAFIRALLLGSAIGLLLIIAQYPTAQLALWLLDGSAAVEQSARDYLSIRIWGAPATLGTYAIIGSLIGLGQTRTLLWLQLLLNGLNVLLDALFVVVLDWGVRGVAMGTLIAEWISFMVGCALLFSLLRPTNKTGDRFFHWPKILHRTALISTLKTNSDIMWRTLFLLTGFGWFANAGAQFGDVTLAANHILLQFISFSAFFLDGFAFALESLVGKTIGARNRPLFDRAIAVSTQIAAGCALGLMTLLFVFGSAAITLLNPLPAIQLEAQTYLPYAAVYVLLSFAAFQLDGIFIGATRSRAMRDASLFSLLVFLAAAWLLVPVAGNQGLWIAFIIYVVTRALCLGIYFPSLRRMLDAPTT
ncbi:MAG TPA: MATE family efflux transporter [Cellvibrio sp.]|nr:MATE family efflux transporter [Cellvibrio sp.]